MHWPGCSISSMPYSCGIVSFIIICVMCLCVYWYNIGLQHLYLSLVMIKYGYQISGLCWFDHDTLDTLMINCCTWLQSVAGTLKLGNPNFMNKNYSVHRKKHAYFVRMSRTCVLTELHFQRRLSNMEINVYSLFTAPCKAAMLRAVLAIASLSVCQSVTRLYKVCQNEWT